jgi:TRAP-type C4-dicarboxylate transport system permease small subunit
MAMLPPGPAAPAPIRALGALVDWSVVAIGAVMVTLVFVNVVLHAFGRDLAWVVELSELLMVWVTFLAGASAARRGAHMTITEFLDKLEGMPRVAADALIQLLALSVLGLLVWYGTGLVQASWGNELTVLGIAMAWQYLALPVGAAAMFVFVAWDLAQILAGKSAAQRFGD